MADLEELERRLEDLEGRLRGESGEPIDLRSLPLGRLQNHLEAEWLPSAPRLVEPKSITAEEIGELPSAVMSTATDDGTNTTMGVNSGVDTWIRYRDTEDDTLGIQTAETGYPTFAAAYSAIVCRHPGMYLCQAGGALSLIAASTHISLKLRVGRAGSGVGTETAIAVSQAGFNAAGGFADTPALNVSRLIRLYENDRIVSSVFQDSGGAETWGGNSQSKEAFMSMTWVSA